MKELLFCYITKHDIGKAPAKFSALQEMSGVWPLFQSNNVTLLYGTMII